MNSCHHWRTAKINNGRDLVQRAKELATLSETWADFGNALFDPLEGLLARAFPTREEREIFMKSDEGREIQELFMDVMELHGQMEGADPKKVTEFMVQCHWTLAPENQKNSPLTVNS